MRSLSGVMKCCKATEDAALEVVANAVNSQWLFLCDTALTVFQKQI